MFVKTRTVTRKSVVSCQSVFETLQGASLAYPIVVEVLHWSIQVIRKIASWESGWKGIQKSIRQVQTFLVTDKVSQVIESGCETECNGWQTVSRKNIVVDTW